MWLFLMDEERRDKVSQQIELVKKKNGLHRDLPLEQTDDLEIFAVLEAAKRVSFTREVAVTGMTSAVENCLGDLKQYTKKCFGISLKLNTPGSKADYIINLSSSDASLPTSRTPESQTPRSGRKRSKTDMDVVRNGQPRLSPSSIRTTQSRALTAAPSHNLQTT